MAAIMQPAGLTPARQEAATACGGRRAATAPGDRRGDSCVRNGSENRSLVNPTDQSTKNPAALKLRGEDAFKFVRPHPYVLPKASASRFSRSRRGKNMRVAFVPVKQGNTFYSTPRCGTGQDRWSGTREYPTGVTDDGKRLHLHDPALSSRGFIAKMNRSDSSIRIRRGHI